jgi:uncharacterized membrane protein
MARDVSDAVSDALGSVVREAIKNVGNMNPAKTKSGPFSGAKGVAAGMGLAAAAPLAKKGFDVVRGNGTVAGPGKLAGKASDFVGDKLKETVSSKVDEAGGAGGLAKQAAGGLLPGGGGDDDDGGGGKGGLPGVGKGRRMPVQQAVDVAVPIETAYNQWTQFEEWPQFMHRVTNVSQEDDCTVRFTTKIWGKTKEFEAKIVTQRPDDRIKWRVSQGITHTGVVTFHELAPRLTRIELTMDIDPGSLIEKMARGMRHIKRAVRADLHRFKAFIEVLEFETGAWRGVIEDGHVTEKHDRSYDKERDYADVDDLYDEDESESGSDEEQDEGSNGNGGGKKRTERFKRQAESSRSSSRSGSSSTSSKSKAKPKSSGRSRSSSSSSSRSRGGDSSSSAKRKPARRS